MNSLRIKGSGQDSNFEDILPQSSEKSSGDAKISLYAEHKQNQLAIIEETNPAPNSYLTWVRSVDDIKTLAETLEDSDWADAETFNPDLSSRRSKTDPSAATHCLSRVDLDIINRKIQVVKAASHKEVINSIVGEGSPLPRIFALTIEREAKRLPYGYQN